MPGRVGGVGCEELDEKVLNFVHQAGRGTVVLHEDTCDVELISDVQPSKLPRNGLTLLFEGGDFVVITAVQGRYSIHTGFGAADVLRNHGLRKTGDLVCDYYYYVEE